MLTQPGHERRLVSVAMADIDHFKEINDTYGHIAGDAVLRDIAGIFGSSLRSADKSARFGGEEFLVLFDRTSLNDANIISERIRTSVMNHTTWYGNDRIHVTLSIGLASNEDRHLCDAESLIKHADAKLYEAKRNGRNRVVG
jgi:diguanylate cyclase (GGDEF)-like protein